jgi:hypothetical protein
MTALFASGGVLHTLTFLIICATCSNFMNRAWIAHIVVGKAFPNEMSFRVLLAKIRLEVNAEMLEVGAEISESCLWRNAVICELLSERERCSSY